ATIVPPQQMKRITAPPPLASVEPWCAPTREVARSQLLELARKTLPPAQLAAEDEPVPSLVVTDWKLVAVIGALALVFAFAITFGVGSWAKSKHAADKAPVAHVHHAQ